VSIQYRDRFAFLSGPRFTINASREVILSAGAVATPQILLLSGIGDKSQVTNFNITSIVDLPDVGQNLQDHVLLPNVWQVNSNFTFDDIGRNVTLSDTLLEEWNTSRKGLYATAATDHIGWLRLPQNASIFESFADPSAGPNSAHYEFIIAVSTLLFSGRHTNDSFLGWFQFLC